MKGSVSVASHNKPKISCNSDSDLKQFIIKYERFVQGQLHFTKKQNHTTKIAGVWFTTWITGWNHADISLKFTKKNQFWASCRTAEVLWCSHSHRSVMCPRSKLRMDFRKVQGSRVYTPLEVKANSTPRWVLPHVISWCWVLYRRKNKKQSKDSEASKYTAFWKTQNWLLKCFKKHKLCVVLYIKKHQYRFKELYVNHTYKIDQVWIYQEVTQYSLKPIKLLEVIFFHQTQFTFKINFMI